MIGTELLREAVSGGLFTGDGTTLSTLNKPFWAKITGVNNSGLHAWKRQMPTPKGFIDLPGGSKGTFARNPAKDPNGASLGAGTFTRLQRGYLDLDLDWVYYIVAASGPPATTKAVGIVASVGASPTNTALYDCNLQNYPDGALTPSSASGKVWGYAFMQATSGLTLSSGATSSSAATAIIQTTGSGYLPGDTIVLAGGSFTAAAQLRVTATGVGGTVAGVVILSSGTYTSVPANPVQQASTNGGGTGASFNITWTTTGAPGPLYPAFRLSSSSKFTARPFNNVFTNGGAANATVFNFNGGSGYAVNDLITLAGGVFTAPAVLKVTSVSSGVITAVSVDSPGSYTTVPNDPVGQASSSGSGSGVLFKVTWNDIRDLWFVTGTWLVGVTCVNNQLTGTKY